MSEKVYCVLQSESYGENTVILKVFKNKGKAEKYLSIQEQLNSYDTFYIVEKIIADDTFNENVKVADYYNYYIICGDFKNTEDDDNWYETEKLIYTSDNYVVLRGYSIDAYSTESYTKAKAIAINEYEKQLGNYFNSELKYEVTDMRNEDDYSPENYLPYDTSVCPICGGKIKHPYTGNVSSEQLDEDIATCQLIEVTDEYGHTLGYHAMCKNNG